MLIDLVGYRRWGHNEGDEPGYTQPVMYERIKDLPTVRATYADQLVREGLLSAAEAEAQAEQAYQRLVDIQQAMKTSRPHRRADGQPQVLPEAAAESRRRCPPELPHWRSTRNSSPGRRGSRCIPSWRTNWSGGARTSRPEGGIDWGHAEALAIGSLLLEGVPIRLTGQDSERGTFSQRHLVLHDVKTGERFSPIQRLSGAQAPIEIHNSPLSELATLGFEYGYSVAAPEALVLWEAQFGDFVNGAQVIVDQFLAAGQSKWGQRTRLTLLLPHGYEGQGPEHSSARLERFLQLCAERNMRVANCTTPAQYFHLLRRQAHSGLAAAAHHHDAEEPAPAPGSRVVADRPDRRHLPPGARRSRAAQPAPRRVVLCSGKLYYELVAGRGGGPASAGDSSGRNCSTPTPPRSSARC